MATIKEHLVHKFKILGFIFLTLIIGTAGAVTMMWGAGKSSTALTITGGVICLIATIPFIIAWSLREEGV